MTTKFAKVNLKDGMGHSIDKHSTVLSGLALVAEMIGDDEAMPRSIEIRLVDDTGRAPYPVVVAANRSWMSGRDGLWAKLETGDSAKDKRRAAIVGIEDNPRAVAQIALIQSMIDARTIEECAGIWMGLVAIYGLNGGEPIGLQGTEGTCGKNIRYRWRRTGQEIHPDMSLENVYGRVLKHLTEAEVTGGKIPETPENTPLPLVAKKS